MPRSSRRDCADPNLVKPGDVVWLDSRHLNPARGAGVHTWPHFAICLFHYINGAVPDLIVTGTIFQFVCISSITSNHPFNPTTQVRLDHTDPNLGLNRPSAACVDFAPQVLVTIEEGRHVLEGVRRLTEPAVRHVPASPTLQAISVLFAKYWTEVAADRESPPRE